MHILLDFITGVSVGIEFYSGEDLVEGDRFAMTIDLLILRLTLIIPQKD